MKRKKSLAKDRLAKLEMVVTNITRLVRLNTKLDQPSLRIGPSLREKLLSKKHVLEL
jgi:hypothetical protein